MNLYEIMLQHFAPKDNEKGIFTYLVADSDEEVYEWLKSNPTLTDDRYICTSFEDAENDGETFELYSDDYEVVGTETAKERLIRLKGDMNDDGVELSDLYYGKTLIGWRMAAENVKPDVLQMIKSYGISLEKTNMNNLIN